MISFDGDGYGDGHGDGTYKQTLMLLVSFLKTKLENYARRRNPNDMHFYEIIFLFIFYWFQFLNNIVIVFKAYTMFLILNYMYLT